MTASSLVSFAGRRSLWIASLIVASVLFTFGFACALPLAAFAAIAALTSGRREALALTMAAWFANQAIGFAFLHYPTDAVTLAWGGALGAIALLSCEAAGAVARRPNGASAYGAAFLASFVVYEGSIVAISLATGHDADYFLTTVSRIFLINICAFVGLWVWRMLTVATGAQSFSRGTGEGGPRIARVG